MIKPIIGIDWGLTGSSCSTTSTTWIEWNLQAQRQTQIQTSYLSSQTQAISYPLLQQQQTAAWYQWNQLTTLTLGGVRAQLCAPAAPRILTPAQIAEQEVFQRERDESLRRRKIEHELATVRARRLLTSHLSQEQRDELEQKGYFTVRPISGRTYRIRTGYSRNIDLVDINGKRIHTLCAHPQDMSLPNEDHMLAQALHLLHNEDEFLAIANRS